MVALAVRLLAEARLQQTVSPQVILQSQLLELTADDLRERIEAELNENPALEMVDDVYHLPPPIPLCGADGHWNAALERLCAPYTLADDLRLQLAGVEETQRSICDYLIDCLDERGFLDVTTTEVAAHCSVPPEAVQEALCVLRSLEPAGIGARNLCECLCLQIQRQPQAQVPPRTADFIIAFLTRTGQTDPLRVARELSLTSQQLDRIIKFVAANLYLWPADQFMSPALTQPATPTLLPDAVIEWEQERLRVRVLQSWSKLLRVSEAYVRLGLLECQETQAGDGSSTVWKIRRARNFIDQLGRREAMLKRVTEAIVKHQSEYFLSGRQALVPLTRKELAAELAVHESTISRITRDKYVQLPDSQLVSFDFFFDGSQSAKSVLRSLIEHEDPSHPFSDTQLAERLTEAGYPLARRTVAKYRDQLSLPSAHERRHR